MYLIWQILAFLALAALIGFAAGWYWRRCREGAQTAAFDLSADLAARGEAERNQSEAQIEALRGERDAALASSAAAAQEIEALKREKEAERVAALKQAAELKEQLASSLTLDTMRRQRDEAISARAALEAEISGLKSAATQAPALASLDALQQRTDELKSNSDAVRAQFDALHARLADIDALRTQKAAVEADNATLRERLAQVIPAEKVEDMRMALARLSAERDSARQDVQRLQNELAKAAQLQKDIEMARSLKAASDAELVDHRRKIVEATNAAQAQGQQVARAMAERDAALRQVQTLQKQVEAALGLSGMLRERDAALAARSALESELAGLRNQFAMAPKTGDLDALRVRIGELDGQRAAAEREVRDLRAQIEAIPDIAEIERARDAAIADRARLSQMLEGLRAQLSVSERVEWRQPVITATPVEPRETSGRFRVSYLAALTPERLDEELRRVGVDTKPIALIEPLSVQADDLQAINGVTPGIERWLNGNGLFFYWQFATLDGPGAVWLARHLPAGADSFVHDHWIAQAARLAHA